MVKVNSVYRATKILKLLAKSKALTLIDICTKLEIPKSSAFDIISTLKKTGFVSVENNQLKKHRLGVSCFEVGSAYLHQIDLTSIVHPHLEDLMNEFKTTAFFVVEDQGKVVYLDKVEPPTIAWNTLPLGSRRDMYCTSLGKALLACYTVEKVKQLIGDETSLSPKTKRTIISYRQLIKDLKVTRKRGYAIDDRESDDNVFCLGVPILNDKNEPVAAISLSFIYYEIKNNDMGIVANRLRNTALEISRRLGYGGSSIYP